MCLSRKTQEEKSKKDEWFSSLQYLNASINDLPISESFLDNRSEFDGFNLATGEAGPRRIPIRNLYTEFVRFMYVLCTFFQIPYLNSVYFIMNYFL